MDSRPVMTKGGMKKDWKKESEAFRNAMRCARGAAPLKGGGGGKGGSKYQEPEEQYDDRTPCPYCGRKFAEVAAQRHIPHC